MVCCHDRRVNAVTLDLCPALPQQPFADATACVNEWRGRCLDAFARAEAAATECLMAMAEVKDRGATVRLPHLAGQRFESLAVAFAQDGAFAAEGAAALTAVDAMRARSGVRAMLCHGVGRVTLNRNGKWTLVLRLTTLRNRQIIRDVLVVTEAEAGQLRDEIGRASQTLSAKLGQVRAKLKPRPEA